MSITFSRPVATASIADVVKLCRPHQYLKNSFVLVGLIFGHGWSLPRVGFALLAFVAFCAMASAVYIANDIFDVEADRAHPTKRNRPIARGVVPVRLAWLLAGALAALGLSLGLAVGVYSALLLVMYALMNAGYSMFWKHVVIVDVFLISGGFMLRLLVGTVGLGMPLSIWLLLCGFMLTLFLGFAKRRAEIAVVDNSNGVLSTRKALGDYSPVLVEQFMAITAACTVLSYSLFTVSPETIARHHTDKLIFTVPFVVYGIFRYLYLLHREGRGTDTSRDLMTDTHMMVVCAAWALATVFVLL